MPGVDDVDAGGIAERLQAVVEGLAFGIDPLGEDVDRRARVFAGEGGGELGVRTARRGRRRGLARGAAADAGAADSGGAALGAAGAAQAATARMAAMPRVIARVLLHCSSLFSSTFVVPARSCARLRWVAGSDQA